jgi:hypothetical protein
MEKGKQFKHYISQWDDYDIVFRVHATQRMFQRDITEIEVVENLVHGVIIDSYKNDYPFPSVLINCGTNSGKQIHVVAALNETEKKIIVITTYIPEIAKWEDGFSKRI